VSTNSQPQLSTQVLQSAVANREAERQEWQKNGAQALDDEEDDEDSEDEDSPTISRTTSIERLQIDDLVDLSTPKTSCLVHGISSTLKWHDLVVRIVFYTNYTYNTYNTSCIIRYYTQKISARQAGIKQIIPTIPSIHQHHPVLMYHTTPNVIQTQH
jgi:hypothetical protein